MTRRAHLLRYAPWLALDYSVPAGLATVVIIGLFGWIIKTQLHFMETRTSRLGVPIVMTPDLVIGELTPLLYGLVFLGIMLAVHGMVSENRRLGYYRFLFTKPVNPVAYYAVHFATCGIAYLVMSLGLLGLWWLVDRPIWSASFIPVMALMYLTFGGIGFFFSAAVGADGLLMVAFTLLSYVLWDQWGALTGIRYYVAHALLPVDRTVPFIHMALGTTLEKIPWWDAVWLGGYGLGAFLLGLVIVRFRSLGEG